MNPFNKALTGLKNKMAKPKKAKPVVKKIGQKVNSVQSRSFGPKMNSKS